MGNCFRSNNRGVYIPELWKRFAFRLKKAKLTVDDSTRKPGIPSSEAVQWFIERDQRTFAQSVSFVPWMIQKGILTGSVSESTDSVVVFRGDGAVVFCDASGFTKLTEYLAEKPNGAELLSHVLNRFFTPLIEIISAYGGDIIKFSGDALTILFVAEGEGNPESEYELSCGSGWARCSGHSSLELSVLRAVACCMEIHKRLDNFDTGIPDRTLSFHIGIGCGNCVVLHVGGECSPEDSRTKRFEFVICGEPLEQIAHACHHAAVYETVVSPQAWDLIQETVVGGSPIEEDRNYKKITALVTSKHTYATIRSAAKGTRHTKFSLRLSDMNLTRRYIPSAVFQQMENGTLEYVNEIRNVTVFFICVPRLDVSSARGACTAQDLMRSVQQACFAQEGQVNKFLVDDKGLLFLCVFGTPPMVHTDDPLRAILSCFKIIQSVKRLGLVGHFGLSTGRVFCGIVGSSARQEYTILGDSVNVAARFMQIGMPNIVLADQRTYEQTKGDLDYDILDAVMLKGKSTPMRVFQPRIKQLVGVARPTCEVPVEPEKGQKEPMQRRGTRMCDIISEETALGQDPLLQCSQWRELKQIRCLLDETRVTKSGGTVVLGGRSGLGKDQLCQQILATARRDNSETITVYATDQGQPRERARPVTELIETCLSVASTFFNAGEEPMNKLELMSRLIEEPLREIRLGAQLNDESNMIEIPLLNSQTLTNECKGVVLPNTAVLSAIAGDPSGVGSLNQVTPCDGVPYEDQFLAYCELLIARILRDKPIILVMTTSRGTSLFNIADNPTFWKLVSRMSEMSYKKNPNPFMVVLLCRGVEDARRVVHVASHKIELHPLSRNCLEEYVTKILRLDSEGANSIPNELIDFVEDLTQGNPLYIMETLEQLIVKQYISRSIQGYVTVNCDLQKDVSLADWSHTSMVGRVICQLEALAPQEAAIVKMASVFQGPFSVLDIAASLKSAYVNARRFDNYRMYRTMARLARIGILSEIPHLPEASDPEGGYQVPINDMSRFPKDTDFQFTLAMNRIPMFILDSYLIRKVARGMILQQLAMKVKRQAMLNRVIVKDLPSRMEQRRARLENLHMPYYNLVKL